MTPKLHSYSSPLALGKKQVDDLFNGVVYIQEKVDGSQFSFGYVNHGTQAQPDWILHYRSRKVEIDGSNAGMFIKAVEAVNAIKDKLIGGYTYRSEFISKNKHNTLNYDRVPRDFIIIYDIDRGDGDYLLPNTIDYTDHVHELRLESVPLLDVVMYKPSEEVLAGYLEKTSILGGPIEGIVLKNYDLLGHDKKTLMGKLVTEDFKESHQTDWKKRNPNRIDLVDNIAASLRTTARWNKAVQHMEEEEKLNNSPQDIGLLIKEIERDIVEDNREEISELLFNHFKKQIIKGAIKGFPEWYKEGLE